MVASAALQVAASRFLFDQAIASGDPATFKTASQLSDASRQNLLAAYELAVREAKLRKDQDGDDVMSLRLASIRAREAAQ